MIWPEKTAAELERLVSQALVTRNEIAPMLTELEGEQRSEFLLVWRDLIAVIRSSEKALGRPSSLPNKKR